MEKKRKLPIKKSQPKIGIKPKKSKKAAPWIIAVAAVVVIIAVLLILKFRPQTPGTSGNVLAMVNGFPIYTKEIDDLYNRLPAQYKQSMTKEDLLNQTISRELLLQEAKKEGIVVQDTEVMQLIESILQQNQITHDQLNQQLAARNLTINDMVQEYKKQMIINKLLNKTVYPSVAISEDEMAAFYNSNKELFDQVRASHILVNSSEEAQKLLNMVKNGADFASLAKTYSLDTASGQQGGDLNYFTRKQMVKEFADAAFNMSVGELAIVKTSFGYHVVKVTAKRTVPFDEAKVQIRTALLAPRQSVAVEKYIQELWKKADIVIKK